MQQPFFIDAEAISDDRSIPEGEALLGWPAFLALLGFKDTVFDALPNWNQNHFLYQTLQKILQTSKDPELITQLYDELFAYTLSEIQTLAFFNSEFLQEKISSLLAKTPFDLSLQSYQRLLQENPKPLLHDLTLYLAWERMCLCSSLLFDDLSLGEGLEVLLDCLMESFLHISKQKKSAPSFFRLMEALYPYFLRPNQIEKLTEEEWNKLSHAAPFLTKRKPFSHAPYVDERLFSQKENLIWTLKEKEELEALWAVSEVFLHKLKKRFPTEAIWMGPLKVMSGHSNGQEMFKDSFYPL